MFEKCITLKKVLYSKKDKNAKDKAEAQTTGGPHRSGGSLVRV